MTKEIIITQSEIGIRIGMAEFIDQEHNMLQAHCFHEPVTRDKNKIK